MAERCYSRDAGNDDSSTLPPRGTPILDRYGMVSLEQLPVDRSAIPVNVPIAAIQGAVQLTKVVEAYFRSTDIVRGDGDISCVACFLDDKF